MNLRETPCPIVDMCELIKLRKGLQKTLEDPAKNKGSEPVEAAELIYQRLLEWECRWVDYPLQSQPLVVLLSPEAEAALRVLLKEGNRDFDWQHMSAELDPCLNREDAVLF